MVNASLNWASICGIILAIWGLIASPLAIALLVIFLRSNTRDSNGIFKIIYTFFQTPLRVIGSLFVGGILFFQGWRLDPILQFGIICLVFLYISESAFACLRDLVKLLQSKKNK